ncbi:MAG: lipid A biosynthesis acyltransferase [Nitrosomonadales bacterium]|nr:MAG: lipid A biosynthesis acyltransferase [Nitrosomonadales bacterium]
MSQSWLSQEERGSPLLMRLITWITLRLGRPAGRVLLVPISLYFLLFSRRARAASRLYLRRALARKPGWLDLYRHYFCFSATILDRLYFLSGRHDYFEIEVHGAESIQKTLRQGRGCVLLGAHLGSFEVLRSLALQFGQVPFAILMHVDNARKMNAIMNSLNPALADSIISMGSPEGLLRAREVIEAGGIVGILGDRIRTGDKTLPCRFFGTAANLPDGPLSFASITHAPVVLGIGLYRGGRRYEVHFEMLAESLAAPRAQRREIIQGHLQHYVSRLEHYCRSAPYNWFNFYDYWQTA